MSEKEGGGASTLFAGDSSPHSQNQKKTAGAASGALFILLFPVAIFTAVIVSFISIVGRISHRVLWAAIALYALAIAVTGNIDNIFNNYVASLQLLLDAIKAQQSDNIAGLIMHAVWLQFPLSVLIGAVMGTIYAYWRWFRRASWEEYKFRLTPYQWMMKKRNIADIQSDKRSPKDGKTVGIERTYGTKIIQTDAEARAHTLIVGSTGSGKTTTLMLMARDIIKRGHGLVFLDLKGSPDVVRILHEYAERYGRDFQHWTMQTPGEKYEGPDPKGPAYYDPLNRGDASRRTGLLMAGRKWSEEYYKVMAQDYLQRAFEVAIATPPAAGSVSSFSDIVSLFNVNNLRERAKVMELKGNRRYDEILRQIDEYFNSDGTVKKDSGAESALKSVEAEIRILTNSTAGAWLRKDPDGDNDINIREVAENGSIVVFSLDSLNYESDANRVGNLIIQDMKTVTSELQQNPANNTLQVYIDEFSAIDGENIVGLINKSRAAGVPVTLSTQAIDDLRRESDSYLGRIVANTNSFIIHRANDYDDAEEYAKLTGKIKKKVFTQSVEHTTSFFGFLGKGAGTGRGSLQEIEDYRVSPSKIQELDTGEAIYIAKSPLRFAEVTVVPEDESKIVIDEVAQKKNMSSRKPATDKKTYESFSSFGEDDEWEKEKPKVAAKVDTDLPSYEIKSADKDKLNKIFNKSAQLEASSSEATTTKSKTLPVTLSKTTVSPVETSPSKIDLNKPEPQEKVVHRPSVTTPNRTKPVRPGLPSKPAGLETKPKPAVPIKSVTTPTAKKAPTPPVKKVAPSKKTTPTNASTPKAKSIGGDWDDA